MKDCSFGERDSKTDEEKIEEVCKKLDRPEFDIGEIERILTQIWANYTLHPTNLMVGVKGKKLWEALVRKNKKKKEKLKRSVRS